MTNLERNQTEERPQGLGEKIVFRPLQPDDAELSTAPMFLTLFSPQFEGKPQP